MTPLTRPFRTLLVANRGEIAARILRTARAMGLRTVAVYGADEPDAPWVGLADVAVQLARVLEKPVRPEPVEGWTGEGGASPRARWLDADGLVEAALRAGAEAIHPGYGFLSENAAFAERCAAAGLVFVGPPPAAIRLMGDKAAALRAMRAAGVPVLPGAAPPGSGARTPEAFAEAAADVGYPLLVKAAAGGGGRGMRIVREPGELRAALASARAEAEGAFGNGDLLLERFVAGARHVEVQVFADAHGNVVQLGERECSVQRRHQKIVEESPSPAISPELRARLAAAALVAVRAIPYLGAGTVELLVAPPRAEGAPLALRQAQDERSEGEFWFLEMNTRLQVEHPVTEEVTGLDLVEWQLRVAMGEPLPLAQEAVRFGGHAIEARLYAEDPAAGFLPQSGTLLRFRAPAREGVRIDAGVREGSVVSPDYDPMIAKVVAHGPTREVARRRLVAALEDTVALGVATNRRFLVELLGSAEFQEARIATDTLDARLREPPPARAPAPPWLWAIAALVRALPEGVEAPWRSSGEAEVALELREEGGEVRRARVVFGPPKTVRPEPVEACPEPCRRGRTVGGGSWTVIIERNAHAVALLERREDGLRVVVDGVAFDAEVAVDGEAVLVQARGVDARFEEVVARGAAEADPVADGRLLTPIAGRVVAVSARAGDRVARGACLAVVEAMKMEHRLVAPFDGRVAELRVRTGDQVAAKSLVARLEPEAPDAGAR
jgi:acetyl/propionyl-CoA carboxylase alpha subunit